MLVGVTHRVLRTASSHAVLPILLNLLNHHLLPQPSPMIATGKASSNMVMQPPRNNPKAKFRKKLQVHQTAVLEILSFPESRGKIEIGERDGSRRAQCKHKPNKMKRGLRQEKNRTTACRKISKKSMVRALCQIQSGRRNGCRNLMSIRMMNRF